MSHEKKKPTTPVALVTGGSRGIGRSTALALAERGIDVILTYVSAETEANEVVRAIRSKGREAAALRLDLGKVETFDGFAGEVKRQLGRSWGRETLDFL